LGNYSVCMCSAEGESWYIESKEKREPGEEGEGEEAVSGGEGWKGNEVAGEGGGEADRMGKNSTAALCQPVLAIRF